MKVTARSAGQERKLVRIGPYLPCPKYIRIYVGLTRARDKLVIVGDKSLKEKLSFK